MSAARPKAVLGVAGGIAAYKVAFVASGLTQRGVDVRGAMTPSALQFVGPATFGGLTNSQPILSSTQVDADGTVPHIEAARGAGIYCIAPATAGVLAQLASGAADDPVALLATTVRCPLLICPAMNDAMWQKDSVQQAVAAVRDRGAEVLGPVEGHLAEGYDAIGRMVEPAAILERICAVLGVT